MPSGRSPGAILSRIVWIAIFDPAILKLIGVLNDTYCALSAPIINKPKILVPEIRSLIQPASRIDFTDSFPILYPKFHKPFAIKYVRIVNANGGTPSHYTDCLRAGPPTPGPHRRRPALLLFLSPVSSIPPRHPHGSV